MNDYLCNYHGEGFVIMTQNPETIKKRVILLTTEVKSFFQHLSDTPPRNT